MSWTHFWTFTTQQFWPWGKGTSVTPGRAAFF
jgi:hypothetical protein